MVMSSPRTPMTGGGMFVPLLWYGGKMGVKLPASSFDSRCSLCQAQLALVGQPKQARLVPWVLPHFQLSHTGDITSSQRVVLVAGNWRLNFMTCTAPQPAPSLPSAAGLCADSLLYCRLLKASAITAQVTSHSGVQRGKPPLRHLQACFTHCSYLNT